MTLFITLDTQTSEIITNTENLIASLEAQLEQARQSLAQVQQERQARLSAKAACESALQQVERARAMVRLAYGQQGLDEFSEAVADTLHEPQYLLPAIDVDCDGDQETTPTAPTPTEPTSIEPTPTEPAMDSEPDTIDIVATVQPTIDIEPKEEATKRAEREYNALSWRELQKYAATRGVNPKGKKRPEIESLLDGMSLAA